ncbi:MAG: uracil-DNA glycosylase [Planctomycetota bacterium]|nr:MAG: uracil-DNA glycosylase [Planctomycetota bacterium]
MSRSPLSPGLALAAEVFLEGLEAAGLDLLPPPAAAAAGAEAEGASAAESAAAGDGQASLAALAVRIDACRACPLGATRTRSVPGEGPPTARVVFVGEAPGADEDRTGRPFVGRAGQLLTRIIENGMGLRRREVFIANVLKCRPPDNRDPLPAEKEACTPWLEEQLRLLRPELIIALGRHSACHLLGRETSLSRLRGALHPRPGGGPPVLATYHPAYLLRNPAAKADCWQDIQLGMRHLGLPLPGRGR